MTSDLALRAFQEHRLLNGPWLPPSGGLMELAEELPGGWVALLLARPSAKSDRPRSSDRAQLLKLVEKVRVLAQNKQRYL